MEPTTEETVERQERAPFPEPSGRQALPAARHLSVQRLMSRAVVGVSEDLGIDAAADHFLAHGLSRVPVVDEEGRLLGMLSKTDLVRAQPVLPGEGTEEGRTVAEVMTPEVITISGSDTVARAAELMAVHRLHALPVIDEEKRVLGIISTLDIVGWVAGL